MSVSYHLIPYNFEMYDFEEFRKEEKECKGEVRWKYGKRRHALEAGDICYFYCTNLPDMTNRILLRAEVTDSMCLDDNNKECFRLGGFTSIRLNESNEKSQAEMKYSYSRLKNDYNIKTVQGKQKLDATGIHEELIKDLESETKTGSLNEVKKFYDNMTKCVFEGHDHNPKTHRTFIKPNGFYYFETHHVIQQNMLRNKKVDADIIDDSSNKVYLCPLCHRKIHYGNKSDVREMLEYLYLRRKDFYDRCYSESEKINEKTDALEWLFGIYGVSDTL